MLRSLHPSLALPVMRQVLRDFWAAQSMEWAAALACYVVLSAFPLLLAGAALTSYLVAPEIVVEQLSDFMEGALPPGVIDLEPILENAIAARRQVGAFAIVAWIISGRRVLGALVTALDRVSDVDSRRETARRRAFVELVLLLGIGVVFLLALASRRLISEAGPALWGMAESPLLPWAGAGMQVILLLVAFYCLYAFVPHGKRTAWAAFLGAAVAVALVLVARAIFLALLDLLWQSFALVYGPLALAALLLTWCWAFGLIVLFGGSVASHVKVMVIEGHHAGEAGRRHVAQKQGP